MISIVSTNSTPKKPREKGLRDQDQRKKYQSKNSRGEQHHAIGEQAGNIMRESMKNQDGGRKREEGASYVSKGFAKRHTKQ